MVKAIEKVSITTIGMDDTEHRAMGSYLTRRTQAKLEADARDEKTLVGITEFEDGEYVSAEEFEDRMNVLAADIERRHRLP